MTIADEIFSAVYTLKMRVLREKSGRNPKVMEIWLRELRLSRKSNKSSKSNQQSDRCDAKISLAKLRRLFRPCKILSFVSLNPSCFAGHLFLQRTSEITDDKIVETVNADKPRAGLKERERESAREDIQTRAHSSTLVPTKKPTPT